MQSVWDFPADQPGSTPNITESNKAIPDITRWRDYMEFPDLSKLAWDEVADVIAGLDRENKLVMCASAHGMFEFCHALIGFEDTLMNFLLEPDSMFELLDAFADWKKAAVAGCTKTEAPAATPTPSVVPTSDTAPDTKPGDTPAVTPNPGDSEPYITLKLAHGFAATSMTGLQYNTFCEALERVSGGKIVVNQLIGGSLLTDTETLDGVMDGTVDFVHSMANYASGTIGDIAPLCVPGYYAGDDFFGFATAVQPILEDIYADYNIKFLGSNYQGTANFVSTKVQIKSPADKKGLSFRSSGTWLGKTIEAWGAAATTIPLPDLTTALERNTVQGSYNGWVITGPFKLYEVADYVTFASIMESYGGLLMNMDTRNDLSDVQKGWIEEARDIYVKEAYDIAIGLYDGYYKDMEDAGTNLYTLTAAEQKAFTDISATVYDEIAASSTNKGKELIRILTELNG